MTLVRWEKLSPSIFRLIVKRFFKEESFIYDASTENTYTYHPDKLIFLKEKNYSNVHPLSDLQKFLEGCITKIVIEEKIKKGV